MPLYEFNCKIHGTFEMLFKVNERPESVQCIGYDEEWEQCIQTCPIQISTPSMQPDKHWAGTKTQSGKIVNSTKEFNEENKYIVPATRANQEYIAKKRIEVEKERVTKHINKLDNFLASQVRDYDIPEGNISDAREPFQERMRRDG